MTHFLIHKLTVKLLLIAALHASVSFDAWSTYRVQTMPTAAGIAIHEDDPLMRPFAKSPAIYPALNAMFSPLDFMILRSHTRKQKWVAYSLAVGAIIMEITAGSNNMNLYERLGHQITAGPINSQPLTSNQWSGKFHLHR
jgi:hypothetical protein